MQNHSSTASSPSFYTNMVLDALKEILGPVAFEMYAALVACIFNGTHSAAASANGFRETLRTYPNVIHLHNEIARFTYSSSLVCNLPEVDEDPESSDSSEDSFNERFLEIADRFAGGNGARAAEGNIDWQQVIQFFVQEFASAQHTQREVHSLADAMNQMGF